MTSRTEVINKIASHSREICELTEARKLCDNIIDSVGKLHSLWCSEGEEVSLEADLVNLISMSAPGIGDRKETMVIGDRLAQHRTIFCAKRLKAKIDERIVEIMTENLENESHNQKEGKE